MNPASRAYRSALQELTDSRGEVKRLQARAAAALEKLNTARSPAADDIVRRRALAAAIRLLQENR